ncbi:hypothetical protein SGFS_066580 [Streptomyces graminofaciens]|uniref:Uncharacterized protein n=1 Tax=Streptomyces graminofaciens TaxID=68212 RepID=A0ABN5VPS6_9ACTN|nr:hypothetical protein [Streptomyces graminofaciens]BBC35364.1 hypothetical protein SGFS_066580 [Streptomyces graminofaciens]
MAKQELKGLKAAASRTDRQSMIRFAAALHDHGCTDREVVRRCYGVEFPDEFFLFARTDPEALEFEFVDSGCLVWDLAVPMRTGDPRWEPGPMWGVEMRAFAVDPGLIPLTALGHHGRYGRSLLCYHSGELAAGRSTVFGLSDRSRREYLPAFGPDARPEPCGPSLLAVLHEHESDKVRMVQAQADDPMNHTGFGAVTSDQVEERREWVRLIEDMQRRLATPERPRPTDRISRDTRRGL